MDQTTPASPHCGAPVSSSRCARLMAVGEVSYGGEHSSQRGLNMEKLVVFQSRVQTLSFDEEAAAHFGTIHASLSRRGIRMGPFDTLIAAHAVSAALTLVTDNVREFKGVKSLRVENWARA